MMNASSIIEYLLNNIRINEPPVHGLRTQKMESMITPEEFKAMGEEAYKEVKAEIRRQCKYKGGFPPVVFSYYISQHLLKDQPAQQFIFAVYHGRVQMPFDPLSFIQVIYNDIIRFNIGDKDFVHKHLRFILKHELAHYFGWEHSRQK